MFDFSRLVPYYAGDPSDPLEWRGAIDRTLAHPRDRSALADALARQQQRRGAPPEARASVERLRDPRSVVIITGQQAGLFGGPLYTLLKALTAVRLAARIQDEHRVPTVPAFWIDAEDHDWDEVSGCSVLDGELQQKTVRLAPLAGSGGRPVGAILLDEAISGTIDELAAALPPTEFSPTLLTLIRNAYRPGVSLAEAFGRWLEMVAGGLGLVVYDASDPATKPLARPLFRREVEYPGLTAELAAVAGNELGQLGYHAQVAAHADALALFRLDGGRRPIRIANSHFTIDDQAIDPKVLLAEVSDEPARFSPNVLLRPIVQDALFPTICYVSGPNELAYLGQLRGVYSHFGVPMPLMYPRASATLLDSAAMRFLSRHEVGFLSLQAQDEAALNHLLESGLPATVEQAYQDTEQALRRGMDALVAAMPLVDATLSGAANSVAGRIEHELESLHGKIIHAAKRRDETLRRQFTRTRAQAFPGGHPQERSTGYVYFLNRYGPALVDRLLAELPSGMGQHWVLTV